MEKINVMIVEDNPLVAEYIAAKLREHVLNIVGIFDTGEAALQQIDMLSPDLILMDIQLAGAMDGVSTAQVIGEKHDTPIIYLTEITDERTFERAKKTFPASYLSKPFNEAELVRAIDVAFSNATARKHLTRSSLLNEFIFVRTDNQAYIKLAYGDILFLKADRAYCNLVTSDSTHILSNSMNHVHEQLANPDFVKVHRSYVVNLKRITAIEGRMIKIGQHTIQMNDEAHDALMDKVKLIK